ncbi:EAL domain-containing protein (putative c-di-GMP-specific phosphodiesterase class I)/GGDEF domain-containing protein [Oceanisphaera litoralis]|uniref:GGDEF and EAL domain-containing protein n=1 Tax=Oceanisphaera litoralis TaxID=225144 RepID=UPI00195A25E9|nr:GGDEF and EAL domain-containing protein [Oceanisphaera litoralis]MBM7456875.1 EAL domain-containing protein (putative c-di-GMP-specific phosphodiesterase class I)/GGDEF domain-containing protein [Oceanisphaera litoralis]
MRHLLPLSLRAAGLCSRVHPFKFVIGGLLLLGMIILGSAATHTLMNIRQHNTLLEQRTYEVPWSFMQLRQEMGRFLDAVRLLHAGAIGQDELALRYDILWSRIPILLNSPLRDSLGDRPDLWLLVGQIDTRVRGVEQQVADLQPGSPDYRFILAELTPYLEPLSRTVTASMHDNVRFYAQYDQAYRQLGKRLSIQIVSLFITFALLLLLLLRELRRYWIQQLRDPLTGLPNRFALQRGTAPMIEQKTPFSVTVLELKDLPEYHHRFGFEVADRLLQAFSRHLQQSLQAHEFIALPWQEKVVVVGRGVVSLEEVRAQLSRFRQALADKISIDAHDFYMTPIMGVVLYPADADNLVDLLARGELALALCRRERLPYVFFDPSLLKEMSRRHQLARDLPAALDSSNLSLQLQPLIEWPSGLCRGLQALWSWHHPGFGIISTTELIRVTEQYQLSERLFMWLLQQICRQLPGWQEPGASSLFVSLQVPPALFRPGLEQVILPVLRQHGLSTDALVLDIDEDMVTQDSRETLAVMAGLRAAGIRMALTEFGSGCSAWGTLSQLPISWLKLDATFCSGIEREGEPRRRLKTLFALARVLQQPLICCGVQHAAELEVLEEMGQPLLVQGDAVGEVLSAEEVGSWLRHRQPR